ncbi:MAG TPA: hypothetical protein VMT30_02990 [Candidatus Saccharimonadia bacterium]|nr:hypothetical protein [Candidatus Saccharimonadia bacterium]
MELSGGKLRFNPLTVKEAQTGWHIILMRVEVSLGVRKLFGREFYQVVERKVVAPDIGRLLRPLALAISDDSIGFDKPIGRQLQAGLSGKIPDHAGLLALTGKHASSDPPPTRHRQISANCEVKPLRRSVYNDHVGTDHYHSRNSSGIIFFRQEMTWHFVIGILLV